jgi:ribosomal protein L37AE/L43A
MQAYAADEKSRIVKGFQCPECFGVRVEVRSRIAFACRECGAQWHADAPQFVEN